MHDSLALEGEQDPLCTSPTGYGGRRPLRALQRVSAIDSLHPERFGCPAPLIPHEHVDSSLNTSLVGHRFTGTLEL